MHEDVLALVTMNARLYDVLMAILTVLDEDTANAVYDAHDKGELKNPKLWLPDLTEDTTGE